MERLEHIVKAIEQANLMVTKVKTGESGILFRENGDGSGAFDVGFIWEDEGFATEMYTRIAENILAELRGARKTIIKEIEEL